MPTKREMENERQDLIHEINKKLDLVIDLLQNKEKEKHVSKKNEGVKKSSGVSSKK